MIYILLAGMSLSCPATRIENSTKIWTSYDAKSLERAKGGCIRYYSPRHCLSTFRKLEPLRYQAICKKNR